MLRRIASFLLLVLAIGFIAFAVTLPRPAGTEPTDGVVVLTGAEHRIDRGLEAVRSGWSRHLLVAGVDNEVKASEFARHYKVEPALMQCCVTLGYESVDTRTNAREVTDWATGQHLRSVRLITSDWHMRRALLELHRTLPADIRIVPDAIATKPSFDVLFTEYCKVVARRAQLAWTR